jgi:hypothetical protein
MAKTTAQNSTQTRIDPTAPFFAAVGGVDMAVALARTGLAEAQTRLAGLDLEPKAIVEDLNKQYADLAARGRSLVGRIRGQESTQTVVREAKKTTTRARTTTTQAKKAAGTAKSSAKATGTSAKRTAAAARKATQDAAATTGE